MRFLRRRKKSREQTYPPKIQPYQRETTENAVLWWETVRSLIDALPWFGQDILPSAGSVRRRGDRLLSEDHQRLLLSFLAGGSTGRMARRVGVGRRTIYSTVERLIYTDDPGTLMEYWRTLGLIECLVTPWCRDRAVHGLWPRVVCLICHDLATTYDWSQCPPEVGTVFRPDPRRHISAWYNQLRTPEHTQGHLVLHFWLRDDPIWFYEPQSEGSWAGLGRFAKQYVLENQWVRERVVRARGEGVDGDPEARHRWRRRVLERPKGASVPAIPHREVPTQAGPKVSQSPRAP